MSREAYVDELLGAINRSGRSDREISISAVGHAAAIRNLRQNRDLRVSTLEALCQEVGLEFYVGPHRAVPTEIAQALGLLRDDCSVADAASVINEIIGLEEKVLNFVARYSGTRHSSDAKETIEKLCRALGISSAPSDWRAYRNEFLPVPLARGMYVEDDSLELIFDRIEADRVSIRRGALSSWRSDDDLIAVEYNGEPNPMGLLEGYLVVLNRTKTEPSLADAFLTCSANGIAYEFFWSIAEGIWFVGGDAASVRRLDPSTRIIGRVAWSGHSSDSDVEVSL